MSVANFLYFDLPGFGRVKAYDGSLKLSGKRREGKVADTGPVGPEEEIVYGELSFKVRNQPGLSLTAFDAISGINVTVQDNGGKTWLCEGAFTTDPATLSGGEIDVSMQFPTHQEIT